MNEKILRKRLFNIFIALEQIEVELFQIRDVDIWGPSEWDEFYECLNRISWSLFKVDRSKIYNDD